MTLHHPTCGRRASVGSVATAAAALCLFLMAGPVPARAAESPVGLGTAANFSVLAGSEVTNTGATTLGQGLGVHPGSAVSGFPPGTATGATHRADGVAGQAKNDLTVAYVDAAGRTPFNSLGAELGGRTLTAGVYRIGAAQLTGQLTLDSENDPAAVFIFQVSSTLVTASNSSVVFINGASPCAVFWQVGSSATLGTDSDFIGTVMALASITMNTGAHLEGRALARNAAVTLDDNVITEPICAPVSTSPTTTPPGTTSPGTTPPGTKSPTSPGTKSPKFPGTTSPTATPTTVPTTGQPTTRRTSRSPGTGPPAANPPPNGPPYANPPGLPLTGSDSGVVIVLWGGGIVLILVGSTIVFRYRKPRAGP